MGRDFVAMRCGSSGAPMPTFAGAGGSTTFLTRTKTRSHEGIAQARDDGMNGTRFGEVKGYDGPPIPSPELPPTHLKARGQAR